MSRMEFAKATASGNDFIIIDSRKKLPKGSLAGLAARLCSRKFSIGADGLLVLLKARSKKADFRMRIFNPDGSEADMCGNGMRSLALYAFKKKIAPSDMSIETNAGALKASFLKNDSVRVSIPDPKSLKLNFDIHIDGIMRKVNFIDTGVPHAVYFVKDLDNFDVKHMGQKTRFHEEFRPDGANVDFVEILDSKNIGIRTYERGVEDETLSCGTGTAASAIIAGLLKNLEPPVLVHTRSKEILKVNFKKEAETVNNVALEGKAKLVFEGRIDI